MKHVRVFPRRNNNIGSGYVSQAKTGSQFEELITEPTITTKFGEGDHDSTKGVSTVKRYYHPRYGFKKNTSALACRTASVFFLATRGR